MQIHVGVYATGKLKIDVQCVARELFAFEYYFE